MPHHNLQDGNVGNLGDILKHAALVQLAKLFADYIPDTRYYLESHSYLYQSRLVNPAWREQVRTLQAQSALYADYVAVELPYISRGEYLCSSGLANKVLPDAHLLLCEANKFTREWLLQQLADNKVNYHTVKARMANWAKGKSFRKLPNLLALIDPFELTDELWRSNNSCLRKMIENDASFIMLVFDYKKQAKRRWPEAPKAWLVRAGSLSVQPYHLAVYATGNFVRPLRSRLAQLGWDVSGV